jgi:tripartite ATP-independent transporter DctM subunit
MSDLAITSLLILILFAFLGSGVWIGLTLSGVAWIGMQLFASRPAGDAMAVTIWGSSSSWTLTALPLFVWMGEILFRTRLSQDMFRGLAPWMNALPGRLLHTNIVGCAIFAAVSGSSAATCATIGKMTLPELAKRGYPDDIVIGTLAGAGTLGLLIPPSIIMIVYGVSAEVSIAQLFIAGVLPGILLATLFSGYVIAWALLNPEKVPPADRKTTFMEKLSESRSLIPVVLLIVAVLGSIYAGIATATEAAAVGVVGSLVLSAVQGSLTWQTFRDDEEAIAIANGTEYGLAGTLFCGDEARAMRIAEQVVAGTLWVNCFFVRDLSAPFGGSRISGIGREGGTHSFDFYCDIKNIAVRKGSFASNGSPA